MGAYEAVVFDLDGTLFDHVGAATAGVRDWLTGMGAEATDALLELWFEAEDRHVAAWHRGEVSFDEQRRRRLREVLPRVGREVGSEADLDRAFARYLARYEKAWRRFDDVDATLSMVATAGTRVAVLTNGAEHQQTQKIAVTGLAGRVGPLFCCDALGYAKPDPRAYQHVCEELGLACEHVLHVGDRYDLDVLGARAAGLAAVHLDRANRGPHHEPARVTTLNDLCRFLGHGPAAWKR